MYCRGLIDTSEDGVVIERQILDTPSNTRDSSSSHVRCEDDRHYTIPGQPKCLCGHYVKNYAKQRSAF